MKPRIPLCTISFSLALVLAALQTAFGGGGPQNVLVVLNVDSPASREIAEHYAAKRRIPPLNVLRLRCSIERSVPFEKFRDEVAQPIRRALENPDFEDRIDYIVLTDGIPIRARLDGGWISTCALLCVLDTPLFGRSQKPVPDLPNPYRDCRTAFSHRNPLGGHRLYLVTFLIGYTSDHGKKLADLSVASDGSRAPGSFLFQNAKGPASGRNRDYAGAIARLAEAGFKAERVDAGSDEVKDVSDLMGYMSGGSYSRLNREAVLSLKFRPGALVDMLESFGAVPDNFVPKGRSQVPVAWFVEAGATGVHGAVAEPYAHTFPDASLFERYTQGYNLAEAFYQSLPFLYWMNMVIGDPLAAPYARPPKVTLAVKDRTVLSGSASVRVETTAAEGGAAVESIRLFFDGRPAGRIPGTGGEILLDTARFRNGAGLLHAAAVTGKPLATQGHAWARVEIRNETLAVVRSSPPGGERDAPCSGPVRIEFNKPLAPASAGAEGLTVEEKGGKRVAGRWLVEEDSHVLRFDPAEPLRPATAHRVSVPPGVRGAEGFGPAGAPLSLSFTTTASRFDLSAPEEVVAGEPFEVEIRALDGHGDLWPGFRGTVRPGTDDGKGRLPADHVFDEESAGKACIEIVLATAGERTITVEGGRGGALGRWQVVVKPGPFEAVRVDLPKEAGLGQEVEATFRAVDGFGNVVTTHTGEYSLAAPPQAKAELDASLRFEADDEGVVSRGGIRFCVPGRAGLLVFDASAKRVGEGALKVVDSAIRSWLMLGPFTGSEWKAAGGSAPVDPASVRPHPGRVEGSRAWTPDHRGGTAAPAAALPAGGAALFHAWVYCEKEGTGLLVGCSDFIRVWVGGKSVFECPRARKFKPDQDRVDSPGLAKGWNGLLVLAGRTGGSAPRFTVKPAGPDGKNPAGLKVSIRDPRGPERLDVSGTVAAGTRGLQGVKVFLKGAGGTREATTDQRGFFAFMNVEKGRWEAEARGAGLEFTPPRRALRVEIDGVSGLTFAVVDRAPPRVVSISLKDRQRVAGRTDVEVSAEDNLGVKAIRFLLDGKPVGVEVQGPSGKGEVDFTNVPAGTHEFGAAAADGSGNESPPASVKIWVAKDDTGPKVRILSPRRAEIFRRKTELSAAVTDDYRVWCVRFLFDGKLVGAELKAEPWRVEFDASGVKPGPHEIGVEAEDGSGNVTKKRYRVLVR